MRRLADRKFRHQVGRFLVEGPQAVREAVRHRPDTVEEVFVAEPVPAAAGEVASSAADAGIPVRPVSERVLLGMTETVHPQGVVAVCRFLDHRFDDVVADAGLVVVLHDVRDPGNAGTILRTADALGADLVVFAGDSVDPYNGKCVRSTAGSLFHVPFVVQPDTGSAVRDCRDAGLALCAADVAGTHRLDDLLRTGSLPERVAWLFGNEAHGLPEILVDRADMTVVVPIAERAESLNLASAVAVCLFASGAVRSS